VGRIFAGGAVLIAMRVKKKNTEEEKRRAFLAHNRMEP
jgi:hypothetical protein